MFTSRTARFAEEIRRETNGRGVIPNSPTGDLLDESWQPTADGGIMAEIGKRDIVECNSLTMESFDCNCSFRAVNLSDTRDITNTLVGDLLGEVFDLINGVVLDRSIPSPATPLTRPSRPVVYARRQAHGQGASSQFLSWELIALSKGFLKYKYRYSEIYNTGMSPDTLPRSTPSQ